MSQTYYLSFVEESVMNPDYRGFIGGRVEVYSKGLYADREIRFFTDRRDEYSVFREKWDFKIVTAEKLAEIEKEIKERFMERGKK